MAVGARHGSGCGDCQWWDKSARGPPWSGEWVKGLVVNNTADPRRRNVLRASLVIGEVCNNVEHPVAKSEGSHRWSGDLMLVLFRLVENRLDFAFFLGDLLIDVAFWESNALRGGHFAKEASFHALQIIPVASLDVEAVLHHDHEVFGANLAEVVGNDDGSLVLAPLFDCLEDQDSGSCIESGSRLICIKS